MLKKKLLALTLVALACSACAGLQSKPGVYEITKDSIKEGTRRVPLIYARPATKSCWALGRTDMARRITILEGEPA